jgi:murein DD-endopeptidase MepM/ murein hydrolase activator NlpD
MKMEVKKEGKVIAVGIDKRTGKYFAVVESKENDKYVYSVYKGLEDINVKKGDVVKDKDVIGLDGDKTEADFMVTADKVNDIRIFGVMPVLKKNWHHQNHQKEEKQDKEKDIKINNGQVAFLDMLISSKFGPRTVFGIPDFHYGIDISLKNPLVAKGLDVAALYDGKVVSVIKGRKEGNVDINSKNAGNLVVIEHKLPDGSKFYSLYAHLDKVNVKVGQEVKAGEKIGTLGNTGRSTNPHLHLGIYVEDAKMLEKILKNLPKELQSKGSYAVDKYGRYFIDPVKFIEAFKNLGFAYNVKKGGVKIAVANPDEKTLAFAKSNGIIKEAKEDNPYKIVRTNVLDKDKKVDYDNYYKYSPAF